MSVDPSVRVIEGNVSANEGTALYNCGPINYYVYVATDEHFLINGGFRANPDVCQKVI